MSDNSDDDNHRDNHKQSIIKYMDKRDYYEMVIIFMVRIISSVLILPVLVLLMKVD